MSRRLRQILPGLLLAPLLAAAILPQRLGDFYQTGTQQFVPIEEDVYREYGFDAAEKSQYAAGERKLEITALRAKDATGAFGMYQWLRPRDSKPVEMGDRGVEKGDTTLFQYGNYVVILRGAKPEEDHLAAMLSILPRYETTPPPPLVKQLPVEGRIPNSERFLMGPVVLEKLAPTIPPSVAGFHLGTEGQVAEYAAAGNRLKLILFSYPTPQLASGQMEEFQKLPDLMVKRSGPLIAAVEKPFSRDEAERLLAKVRYEATLTWSQRPQVRSDDIGEFLIGVVVLVLVLIGFSLVAGLGLGGLRLLLRKWLPGTRLDKGQDAPFIRLHLGDQ